MEWFAFNRQYPQRHYVIGAFSPSDIRWGQQRFSLLARLVIKLNPSGAWALHKVIVSRQAGIHVAYECQEDAAALQTAVGAQSIPKPTNRRAWLSQSEFWFDQAASERIAAQLDEPP